jgi:UDP-N-acetylglucosamine 2-epimerase (hydrolysing)
MDKRLKNILFVTGTRADFGKLKPLMRAVEAHPEFESIIFATGMHLLYRYGMTVEEIHKAGFTNIFTFMNQVHGEPMDLVLANTVSGLSRYTNEHEPDLIIVHGDRVETLAGAIVGALRNILVGHIEGGELSGTVDELIRHSVSKLAHIHFVANSEARQRLLQLGEARQSIHVIGSPDIDIMLSNELPDIGKTKRHYGIDFENYAIVLYHAVTTEPQFTQENTAAMVKAVIRSNHNFIVIYPNNDAGSDIILKEYSAFAKKPNIKIFPSLRFELFLSLLKNADYIMGNSSAGIHEAPVFGVPTINIGSRQKDRFTHKSITNVDSDTESICSAMKAAVLQKRFAPCNHFGLGNSAEKFMLELAKESFWKTNKQKTFHSLPNLQY